MRKILLIGNSQVEKIAGSERYNSQLVDIFYDLGFEIDEYAFVKKVNFTNKKIKHRFFGIDLKQYDKKSWYFKNLKYRVKIEKDINKILSKNTYDIIINSTNVAIKQIMWNDNYIWIQHFDSRFIQYSNLRNSFVDTLKSIIFRFLLKINNSKTCLLNSRNIVTYYDGYIPKKWISNKINYNYVSLTFKTFLDDDFLDKIDFSFKQKSRILYLGRIEQKQKNILFLLKNFNNIDYYGVVEDKTLVEKMGDNYKGVIESNDELNKVIQAHSFLILPSNFEGFSYVIVESLSNATPIIASDKIYSTNFYFKDKSIGYIINTNSLNIDNFKEKINSLSLDEYKQMSINSFEFAQSNFNYLDFKKKWENIIFTIIDKQKYENK